MSLKDKILKAVRDTGGSSLQDIYAATPGHSRPSVRGTVYKMVNAGALEKTPEGKYRPKESAGAGETESAGGESDTEPGGDESAGAESPAPEPTGEPAASESIRGEAESEGPGEESPPERGDESAPVERPDDSEAGDSDSGSEAPGEAGEDESPGGEPGDEAEKPTADEALAEALEKFAGSSSGGSGGPPQQGKMQKRKDLLPTADEAGRKVQDGYIRQGGFSDGGVSPHQIWVEQEYKFYAVILQGPASLGLKPRLRLPDALVQDGREARNKGVARDYKGYLLKHLFDALRDIGVKNTKRLRERLRFDVGDNLYAFTEGSEVVIVVAQMGVDDPRVKYELEYSE